MQLSVTVHFYHKYLIIILYELIHFRREGHGAHTHEIGLDTVFFFKVHAGLINRRFSGAVWHYGNAGALGQMHNWFGYVLLGSLKFSFEALHIAIESTSIFGVFGIFIMTSSTCEVGTQRIFIAWECAVGDTIAIFIEVTSPIALQLFKVFFAQYFAAIHRDRWILEWLAHPLIHAHIQIREYKDWCLNALGKIESLPAKIKTFVNISRHQDNTVAIAMAHADDKGEVSLGGASGQACARSNALNIPDNDWHFGIISETGKLSHEA